MLDFRCFFDKADPAVVAANLALARDQIEHYRPHSPPGDVPTGGGHACLDENYPEMNYENQGIGTEARLIVGVKTLKYTKDARAYNIIHEATHGAPGLKTIDHAYYWQRLFAHIKPDQQVKNADSYAQLAGILAGLRVTPRGSPKELWDKFDLDPEAEQVTTTDLPRAVARAAQESWAWFEFYSTKLVINISNLYPAIARGIELQPGFQADFYRTIARVFGLVPGEYAALAGIIPRVKRLLQHAETAKPVFVSTPPGTPLAEPQFALVVPTALGSDVAALTRWQIEQALPHVQTIAPKLRRTYLRLYVETAKASVSDFGGPLAT
jgi:hypothetical protein